MALSNELISQFVKATQDTTKTNTETTAYGKIIVSNGVEYVQLDGSDLLTPISSTTVVNDGDRVIVTVKNHTATVTGDLTNPSASNKEVQEIGNKISEFEIVIADKVTTEQLEAEIARIETLRTEELEATNAKIETLNGKVAEIDTIKADVVEVEGKVTANEADITTLRADIADFKDVTAEEIDAVKGDFNTLNSDYADFKVTTTNKLTANEASIADLETNKLDTVTANAKYATIDFSNIGEAAIEKLFSDSGIIKDLIMSDGKVTGELVGVTIKGDLIEGNTVKADKLVIQGEDGLYYKLNVNALGETTASSDEKYQNGLDGSNIIAESITAEKIAVDDLVAFGATIGGYHIDTHSLYSGVKNSIDNTTRGVYLGDDGQINIGDSNNYLKFYVDEDGTYKLELQANSIKFGASGTTVEEAIGTTVKSTEVEYYLSTSTTTPTGGSWQTTAPEWVDGKYMWTRTKVTLQNGTVTYNPSENGTCIAGATGATGPAAEKPETIKTIEGTELTIDDGKQIAEFKIYGNSEQFTSISKNIFNKSAEPACLNHATTSKLENGIRVTRSGNSGSTLYALFILSDIDDYVDKTLRIKCDFTSNVSTDIVYYALCYIKENKQSVLTVSKIITKSGVVGSVLIEEQSDYKYIGVIFCIGDIAADDYVDFTNIIVTIDNDDMTYEDYYPSEIEIESVGAYNEDTGKYDINLITQNNSKVNSVISLNEPLRGFQNGIKDEALIKDNTLTLTKNIKELVITSDGTTEVTIDDMVSNGHFMSNVGGSITDKTITFDSSVTDATIIYELLEPVVEEIGTIENIPMDKDSINTYYVNNSVIPNMSCTYYTVYAGIDGKDGEDGERIVSITSEFYLSTSKETPTGGEWSTTTPTWSSGMYVWTRSKIEYSNPTSIEYTEPLCDSSWEAANQVKDEMDQAMADKSDEIYKEIIDQRTEILTTTESLILQAAADYVITGDFEAYKETVESQLQVMADNITLNFITTSNAINDLETSTSDFETTVKKYFQFSEDGLIIGGDTSAIKLTIDNDEGIIFSKNGEQFGYWDGDYFYTGNIKIRVNERAQLGNYAYIPRSDDSLMFLKVE